MNNEKRPWEELTHFERVERMERYHEVSCRLIGVWNYTRRHIFPLPNDWRDLEIYIEGCTPSCVEKIETASFGDMSTSEVRALIKRDIFPRGKEEERGGQFWSRMDSLLFSMCAFYLHYACPPAERTFINVLKLIHCALIPALFPEELRNDGISLPVLFGVLERENPNNEAVYDYSMYSRSVLVDDDVLHTGLIAGCQRSILDFFEES